MDKSLQAFLPSTIRPFVCLFGREQPCGLQPFCETQKSSPPVIGTKKSSTPPEPTCRWVAINEWYVLEEPLGLESSKWLSVLHGRDAIAKRQENGLMKVRKIAKSGRGQREQR